MVVRVYNHAGASAFVLINAQRKADQVFEPAGVDIEWLDCPTSVDEMAANRACAAALDANHLVVQLLPHSMSKKYGLRREVFGFALPTTSGRPGNQISLFFKRVLDLAYYGSVGTDFEDAQGIILGYMMAHEIGHLLLGPESHAASGVMSFPWGKRTLTSMERGGLQFSPGESEEIREELARRALPQRE